MDRVGIPFIITLSALLEAAVNDHLHINILKRYGRNYLPYYQAFEKASLKTRMMFAIEL